MAFFLPPLARRNVRRATFHFARNRERGAAHLIESPAAFHAHVHVHPARSGSLRPSAQIVFIEDIAHDQRDASDIVKGNAGAGIEIDTQLIRMIEVVSANGMRIEIDASEVDNPQELGGVADDDLAGRASGGEAELDGLDPVGVILGRAFLKKRLLIRTVHVAFEHERPARDAAKSAIGDRGVILHEIQLRVAGLRKKDFVGVGDHDFAAGGLEDGLLRLRHKKSLAGVTVSAQVRSVYST
jgi:hypothetical protein